MKGPWAALLSAAFVVMLPAQPAQAFPSNTNNDDSWVLVKIGPIPIVRHRHHHNTTQHWQDNKDTKSDWKPPAKFHIKIGEVFTPANVRADLQQSGWSEDPDWLRGDWHSDNQTTTQLDVPAKNVHYTTPVEMSSKFDLRFGTHKSPDGRYWHYVPIPGIEKCKLTEGATYLITTYKNIAAGGADAIAFDADQIQIWVDDANVVKKITRAKSHVTYTRVDDNSFKSDTQSQGFDWDGNALTSASCRTYKRAATLPADEQFAHLNLDKMFDEFCKSSKFI